MRSLIRLIFYLLVHLLQMFRYPIILPTFLSFQGIAGKRLCPFSVASQEFLDYIIVLMMGSTDILLLIALIVKVIAAWSWRLIRLVNRVAIWKSLSLIPEARSPSEVVNFHQNYLIILLVCLVGRPHDGTWYLIITHTGPKWLYHSLLLLRINAVLRDRTDVDCMQVRPQKFVVF